MYISTNNNDTSAQPICANFNNGATLAGGEYQRDVDEYELDDQLARLKIKYNNNDILLKAGFVKDKDAVDLKMALKESDNGRNCRVFIPFWCRHHWLLIVIESGHALVFDSAPSECVRRDVSTWCVKFNIEPIFMKNPCQFRDSRECGIFVMGFFAMIVVGKRMRHDKVRLENVRRKLVENKEIELDDFENLERLEGGGEWNWQAEHDILQSASARKCLCYMLTSTILVNAHRVMNGEEPLPWRIKDLENRAKVLGFALMTEHDAGEAIDRMIDKKVIANPGFYFEDELKYVRNDLKTTALFRDGNKRIPSGFECLLGITYLPFKPVRVQAPDGSSHMYSESGHYIIVSSEAEMSAADFKLIRRTELVKSVNPSANVNRKMNDSGEKRVRFMTSNEQPKQQQQPAPVKILKRTQQMPEKQDTPTTPLKTPVPAPQLQSTNIWKGSVPAEKTAPASVWLLHDGPPAIVDKGGRVELIRRQKVKAIMRLLRNGEGFMCHWVLNNAAIQMWGIKCMNDDDEDDGDDIMPKIKWSMKPCECGGWRPLDEDLITECPIPHAEYYQALPLSKPVQCQCGGDDEEEERAGPECNVEVEQQWKNLDELERVERPLEANLMNLKGNAGMMWKIIKNGKPRHVHKLVWSAAAVSTRRKHVDWLVKITEMPRDLWNKPLDVALVDLVVRRAKERNWAWSTTSSAFSTIQTALRSLQIYSNEASPIDLKKSVYFQAAMLRAQKLARTAGHDDQLTKPIAEGQVLRLIKGCKDLKVRTLLAMCWCYASRVGDMRQVEASEIILPPNNTPKEPTCVTIKRGKGGACWGNYSLHAVLPLDTAKDMAELITTSKSRTSLWSTYDQRKLSTLIAAEGLNLRAIRRGALLFWANQGTPDVELLTLSGHKRLDTLHRYLGWGVHSNTSISAAKKRNVLKGGEGERSFISQPKKMGPFSNQGMIGQRMEHAPFKFLNRPPTSRQLGLLNEDPRELKIHVKNVSEINIDRLKEFAQKSNRFGQQFLDVIRWLQGEPYDELNVIMQPKHKIPRATFSAQQIRDLRDAGKIRPLRDLPAGCTSKFFVNGFPLSEVPRGKIRARAINEAGVNKYTDRTTIPTISHGSRLENRATMIGKRFVVDFDFAAYFDQFSLEVGAQEYMVMRTEKVDSVDMWVLTKLPMGATFSPAIAQYATWIMCEDIERIPGVSVTTMIDNVRIAAEHPQHFATAVRMFLKRCKDFNVTLNEEALPYINARHDGEIIELGRKQRLSPHDFLGECYVGDIIRNTDKSVDKLKRALEKLSKRETTRRQVAQIIGLMIFMAHTLNIDLAIHFNLMRMYSRIFDGLVIWDESFYLQDNQLSYVFDLARPLLDNEAVPLPVLAPPPNDNEGYDAVIVFDACKAAWAARVFDTKTKKCWRIMKSFDSILNHSAHAEPAAAFEILSWFKAQFPKAKHVALVTDHKALVLGQRRWWSHFGGHSTAFFINRAFQVINGFAQVFHVDGEDNICDGDSRSETARKAKDLLMIESTEDWPQLSTFFHPYLTRPATVGF